MESLTTLLGFSVRMGVVRIGNMYNQFNIQKKGS